MVVPPEITIPKRYDSQSSNRVYFWVNHHLGLIGIMAASVQSLGDVVFGLLTTVITEIDGRRARYGDAGRVHGRRVFLTFAGLPPGLFTKEELIL